MGPYFEERATYRIVSDVEGPHLGTDPALDSAGAPMVIEAGPTTLEVMGLAEAAGPVIVDGFHAVSFNGHVGISLPIKHIELVLGYPAVCIV